MVFEDVADLAASDFDAERHLLFVVGEVFDVAAVDRVDAAHRVVVFSGQFEGVLGFVVKSFKVVEEWVRAVLPGGEVNLANRIVAGRTVAMHRGAEHVGLESGCEPERSEHFGLLGGLDLHWRCVGFHRVGAMDVPITSLGGGELVFGAGVEGVRWAVVVGHRGHCRDSDAPGRA